MALREEIAERVIKDDATGARELTHRAIEGAIPPQEILRECLIIAPEEVGRKYEEGDYLIPSMLVAG